MFEICKSLLAGLLGMLLVGCGGVGSADPQVLSPPPNVLTGVFSSTINGNEVVSLLASDSLVDSSVPNWFGFQFSAGNASPDLYAAHVSGTGLTQASGVAIKYFQGLSSPRTGNISLSMSQSNLLSSQLSFPSNTQENALNLNWQTSLLPNTQYNDASSSAVLSGNWIGNWYFGLNVISKTVVLTSGNISGQSIMTHCDLDTGSSLSPTQGENVYRVNLYIKVNTQCAGLNSSNTQSALYQGLAWVINQPHAGASSELILLAVSPDHKAVFFRGYQ